MKLLKQLIPMIGICLLAFNCMAASKNKSDTVTQPSEDETSTKPHAQLYSAQMQTPGPTSVVTLEKVDNSQQIQYSHGKVTVDEPGLYFVMAAAQVGDVESKEKEGYVNLWLAHNGKNIANSNTRSTIKNNSTTVLVSQSVMQLQAHDSVSVNFSSNDSSLGLVAIPANGSEPAIPSIIFTIYKI